jgi:hypothetical protein
MKKCPNCLYEMIMNYRFDGKTYWQCPFCGSEIEESNKEEERFPKKRKTLWK